MNKHTSHLRLLSIFHFITGGIALLFSSMSIGHIVLGVVMIVSPEVMSSDGEMPPDFIGYLFAGMGALFLLVGVSISACIIYSGWLLRKQQKYMFSFVVACIECIFMPLGTILGVFTIIVLSKDPVKKIYGIDVEET